MVSRFYCRTNRVRTVRGLIIFIICKRNIKLGSGFRGQLGLVLFRTLQLLENLFCIENICSRFQAQVELVRREILEKKYRFEFNRS